MKQTGSIIESLVSRRRMLAGLGTGLGLCAIGARSSLAGLDALPPTITPGSLTVAITGDMPMTSINSGMLIGADGDMISLIAERLQLKVAPVLMDWTSCIESVRSGRADMTLGNMGWTMARADVMRLTDAVYYTGKFTLMRKDMPIGDTITLEDYKGHSLGTVTAFSIVPELKKVPGATEVKLYDNSDACVRDVRAGRLDFALLDTPTVAYMIQQNPDWDLKLVPTSPFPGYAFSVRSKSRYSALIPIIPRCSTRSIKAYSGYGAPARQQIVFVNMEWAIPTIWFRPSQTFAPASTAMKKIM